VCRGRCASRIGKTAVIVGSESVDDGNVTFQDDTWGNSAGSGRWPRRGAGEGYQDEAVVAASEGCRLRRRLAASLNSPGVVSVLGIGAGDLIPEVLFDQAQCREAQPVGRDACALTQGTRSPSRC
jgi:hypothetical protein